MHIPSNRKREISKVFEDKFKLIKAIQIKHNRETYIALERSTNTKFIVKRLTGKSARYEYRNLNIAFKLYSPYGIKTPRPEIQKGFWLIMEYIKGKRLDTVSDNLIYKKNIKKSLVYLYRLNSLHSISKLIDCRPNHYTKPRPYNVLINNTNDNFKLALFNNSKLNAYNYVCYGIFNFLNDNIKYLKNSVISHGDFKADNLILHKGKIVAVDWSYFEIMSRWKSIGGFLNMLLNRLDKDDIYEFVEGYLKLLMYGRVSKDTVEHRTKLCIMISLFIELGKCVTLLNTLPKKEHERQIHLLTLIKNKYDMFKK